ncbi:hypothetical protein IWQ62_000334 [Dispira parvispora]|uniref:Uncharacterized protein n=1 Tax=Dispira parvispora TaxID=1520584 RepID=A0A9W8B0B1_9FUNG|nr:hypothetical protein IWQ62_000334 [Dispira parvispora]
MAMMDYHYFLLVIFLLVVLHGDGVVSSIEKSEEAENSSSLFGQWEHTSRGALQQADSDSPPPWTPYPEEYGAHPDMWDFEKHMVPKSERDSTPLPTFTYHGTLNEYIVKKSSSLPQEMLNFLKINIPPPEDEITTFQAREKEATTALVEFLIQGKWKHEQVQQLDMLLNVGPKRELSYLFRVLVPEYRFDRRAISQKAAIFRKSDDISYGIHSNNFPVLLKLYYEGNFTVATCIHELIRTWTYETTVVNDRNTQTARITMSLFDFDVLRAAIYWDNRDLAENLLRAERAYQFKPMVYFGSFFMALALSRKAVANMFLNYLECSDLNPASGRPLSESIKSHSKEVRFYHACEAVKSWYQTHGDQVTTLEQLKGITVHTVPKTPSPDGNIWEMINVNLMEIIAEIDPYYLGIPMGKTIHSLNYEEDTYMTYTQLVTPFGSSYLTL